MNELDFYCEKVLTGRVRVEKVLETEHVLAFHHTKPSYPIHIVVIPKWHTRDLVSFLEDQAEILAEMVSVIAQIVTKVTAEQGGCRLTTNFGTLQNTEHLHWHIYVSDAMQ